MPQNEPRPNRLSLGASIIHVPARSSPAQNRSRRFSVTYICAGKGSPGLRGWWGWLAESAAAHPTHPPSLCFSLGLPIGSSPWPASCLSGPFSSPPVAACLGWLRRQARREVDPFRWPGVPGRHRHLGFPGPCKGDPSSARGWVGEQLGGMGNFSWVYFLSPSLYPLLRPGRSVNSPWGDL